MAKSLTICIAFRNWFRPKKERRASQTHHSRMNNTSTYFSPYWSVMKICMRHRAGCVEKWLFKSPCCEAKSAVSLKDWNTAFWVGGHTGHTRLLLMRTPPCRAQMRVAHVMSSGLLKISMHSFTANILDWKVHAGSAVKLQCIRFLIRSHMM